jgi:hypothetical protein
LTAFVFCTYRPAFMRPSESNTRVDCILSLRRARLSVWLGVAALLLRLTAPFLHALEIGSAHAPLPATALHLDARTGDVVSSASVPTHPVPVHDPEHCPICSVLSHVHAVNAEAARAPVPHVGRVVVSAETRTAPSSDVAGADARAPPFASLIAIS